MFHHHDDICFSPLFGSTAPESFSAPKIRHHQLKQTIRPTELEVKQFTANIYINYDRS